MIALVFTALRDRWRAYTAIAVLALFVGVLAGLGAAYPRSVADGLAQAEISAAAPDARILTLAGSQEAAGGNVSAVAESTRRLPGFTSVVGASVSVMGFGRERSLLAYREGFCAHITLTAGRCPLGAGEVVVPAARAAEHKIGVGTRLMLTEAWKPDPKGPWSAGPRGTHPVEVVGLYQPVNPADDYWGVKTVEDAAGLQTVLTMPETLHALPHGVEVLSLTAIPDRALLATGDYAAFARTRVDPALLSANPNVKSLMERIAAKRAFVETMTPAVVLPVLALGCWALFLLVSTRLHRDRPEVAAQALRGLPLHQRWWLAAGGSALPVAIATPLGGLACALLVPGAGRSSVTAALWVLAAELVVITFAAVNLIRVRPLDLLRRVLPENGRVPLTEVAVVTLTGAAFVQMQSGDRAGLGIFAASLVAIAIAAVTSRVLPHLLRPVARGALRRGSLTWGLALALITRRVSGRHLLALTSAAAALLTLVVGAYDVATTTRTTQIDLAIGADRILLVENSAAHARAIVDKIDPEGRYAMAVGRLNSNGMTMLAVDSRRAAIMRWSQAAQAAQVLGTAKAAPITVTGSRLEVTLDGRIEVHQPTDLPPGVHIPASPLTATIELPDGQYMDLEIGQLRPGTATYGVNLPEPCAAGADALGPCRLAALSMRSFGLEKGPVELRSVSVDGKAVADGQGWHTPATQGKWSLDISVNMGAPLYFLPPDVPEKINAVVTDDARDSARQTSLTLRGGQRAVFTTAANAQILPRVGTKSMLVDLSQVLRSTVGSAAPHHVEVWLAADAPADLVGRLGDAGLIVLGEENQSTARRLADRTPPALTLRMQLIAAVAGVVVLLGVVVFLASGDRRPAELAGLRTAGLRAAIVRRATRTAYLAVLGLGVVLGLAAAAVAWSTARAVLPIVDGTPWLPPPSWPDPGPVALAAGAVLALVGLGVAATFAIGRSAGDGANRRQPVPTAHRETVHQEKVRSHS
ncbi:MAG: hypothetical protein HOV79_01065 [Hamadaea sp.]|nr:hypothetical protein [Hamadaea sp.]